MKFLRKYENRPWMNYTIALCIAVILFMFLSRFSTFAYGVGQFFSFISPVIVALVIAYVLNPLAGLLSRLLRKRMKHEKAIWTLSVTLTILLVIVLFILLLIAVIPQLVSSVIALFGNLDSYAKTLNSALSGLEDSASSHNLNISGVTDLGQKLINQVTGYLSSQSDNIISTVTGVGSNVVNGVISFILAIYFLMDKAHLTKGLFRFNALVMSRERYEKAAAFWSRCNAILVRYIWCDLLDGLIIGCANAVFMLITGMPSVALVSVVVGVTNLAPTFGPIVGAVIGSFILLMDNPWNVLWFLIFTIILQTFDGYVLKPRMFGSLLGVPGVWILIMIIIGGRMFGVVGILVAIPAAAILSFVYGEYIVPALQRRKKKTTVQA